jgi:hypothetical protein
MPRPKSSPNFLTNIRKRSSSHFTVVAELELLIDGRDRPSRFGNSSSKEYIATGFA